jgi:hypothetical protein
MDCASTFARTQAAATKLINQAEATKLKRSSRSDQAGRIARKVGQYAIGASAFEGQQAFHHHRIVVEPAVLRGGFEHGIFA